MKKMTIKHNETGRSMVEMLGVLAVVGVLSIGGVAGYRYAVDKMNANEIINELKKRAITASQQRVLGQDINLAEYGVGAKIKGTYTVRPTDNYNGNASQFALEVAGVPERVCDMIIDSDWALPTAMAVNGGSCVEGANGNTMTFAFNNALGRVDVGNGETPDVTTAVTTAVTATETEVSESDEIWTDLDETEVSESDEIWTDLDETATETEVTETETEVSESDEIWTDLDETATEPDETATETESTVTETVTKQQICDKNNNCYDCSYNDTIYVANASECSKCDESGYKRVLHYYSSEMRCSPYSHCNYISDHEDHIKESCGKCGLGVDWNSLTNLQYYSCASGPEDVGMKPVCSGDNRTGFIAKDGTCYSCWMNGTYSATAEECAKCGDTRYMTDGGSCAKVCGNGEFMDSSGYCYSCSTSSRPSATANECSKCDNTSTPRVMSPNGYYCALPCSSGQFMDSSGYCYSCSSGSNPSATANECDKCNDTSTPRILYNGYCVLPCKSGEFKDRFGNCYSCSYTREVYSTTNECAKCNDTSTPRYMSGDYCRRS